MLRCDSLHLGKQLDEISSRGHPRLTAAALIPSECFAVFCEARAQRHEGLPCANPTVFAATANGRHVIYTPSADAPGAFKRAPRLDRYTRPTVAADISRTIGIAIAARNKCSGAFGAIVVCIGGDFAVRRAMERLTPAIGYQTPVQSAIGVPRVHPVI